MNKKQREKPYATNTLLEHVHLDPDTNVVNPTEEAIIQAKECVDDNEK